MPNLSLVQATATYEIWLFGPGGLAQQVDECGSHCSQWRAREVAAALAMWLHTGVWGAVLRDLSPRRRVRRCLLMMPYDLRERGTGPVDPADVDVCVIPQADYNLQRVAAPLGSRYHASDEDAEPGEEDTVTIAVSVFHTDA